MTYKKKLIEVIRELKRRKFRVIETDISDGKFVHGSSFSRQLQEGSGQLNDGTVEKTMFTLKGSLGVFSGVTKRAALFVGYDSLGQHIAAALKIPTLTIFSGHMSNNFLKRWTPFGENKSRVIEVDCKKLYVEVSEEKRMKYEMKIGREVISALKEYKNCIS